MFSVLYPESNFWWVFGNGPKVFPYFLLPFFSCFGLPFSRKNTDKLLIFIYLLLKEDQIEVFRVSNITTKGINNTG